MSPKELHDFRFEKSLDVRDGEEKFKLRSSALGSLRHICLIRFEQHSGVFDQRGESSNEATSLPEYTLNVGVIEKISAVQEDCKQGNGGPRGAGAVVGR